MALQPFSQIPFLALVDKEPTSNDQQLYAAIARVTPLLVPASLFDSIKAGLPSNAEYYVWQDVDLPIERVYEFLDNGATRFVSKDLNLLGEVPSSRLILQIDPSTATHLADARIIENISGILLETPSLVENLLKSFRSALATATGRRRDIFVLPANRDLDTLLHLPSSLKLMSKTVTGTSVIPTSLLSLDLETSPAPRSIEGRLSITNLFISAIRTDRDDGLFPTMPVSLTTVPSALGLVYSSRPSIANTILSGNAVYFSRSRGGLWRKGETSGALQAVERIRYDCDADALEFQVVETGPNGEKEGFCHVPGQQSCFGPTAGLVELESTLKARKASAPAGSYTARLFSEPSLLRAKIMEEAQELCDATSAQDVAAEAADLIYFALTKCVSAGVGLRDVSRVLAQRSLKVTRRKGDAKKEWVDKLGLTEAQSKGVNGHAQPAPPRTEASKAETTITTGRESSDDLKCQVYDASELTVAQRTELLKRPLVASADMQARIAPIMSTVRTEGDKGLRSLVAKFDRCAPAENESFPVTLEAPFPDDMMKIDPKVKAAIDQAYANIKTFHQAQMDKETKPLQVETMPGIVCSRFARPIEKVGLYVPGGTAILPSTAIMLATPAQIAQCSHVTIATPPRPDGSISPEIVYIASLTNVKTIVKAGGAHAVAAMAYGTESIPKVDKIFGPGNQFVTAAKMAVSTDSTVGCAIDMPAGPSEVLVIADRSCKPEFVASDLLSQAEHGADSQVVLLTIDLPEAQLADIEREIKEQALSLPRVEIMRKSIAHSIIVKCKTLDEAFDYSNAYAPEHLILHLDNASSTLPRVKHAGSVFVGPYSPESCGDYASGTNHSLPTYGYARQYSGVSTSAFLKHITSQELTQDGLRLLGPTVETLAAAEGLDAHRMAVTRRLKQLA